MATLTPVDHDPFAAPGAPNLTPVDHDPFASTQAAQPTQSWPDYLLGHLHSFSQGLDAATRVATDAPTFGLMDKLFGSKAQADTAAAHKALGGWDLPVSLAGSMVTGLPELKAASAIGEALPAFLGGGKWAGGVLGSGAVGAGTSALGAYGHEQGWSPDAGDIGTASAIGGGLGAGGGMFGGVVGRGGALGASETAADLAAKATDAYTPLDQLVVHGPQEVHPRLQNVEDTIAQTDLTGAQRDAAKSTMAVVNNLRKKTFLTGRDLQQAHIELGDIANSGRTDINDQRFAPQFRNALTDVMNNAPTHGFLQPGAGSQRTLVAMPGPPGEIGAAKTTGDALSGMSKDVGRLDTMADKANVAGGPDIASQARDFLLSKEGQKYAAPGTPLHDSLNNLAGTITPSPWSPTTWDVKHHLLWPVTGLAVGQGIGALGTAEGAHPWWAMPAEDVAGLAAGIALRGRSGALRNAAIQRAAQAARVTASTGLPQAPILPEARFSNAVRQLIYGEGGRGAY